MTLLDGVKEELKITWDDEDGRLQSLISRAKAYLNDLAGVELDFEEEGVPKDLLLARCRYVYNNAGEYFEENFAREILRMQLREAAKHKKKVVSDGTD